VCIEALSQGLPTIATVCGGPEEFVNDSNGILIPAENTDAMAKAMIEMYENYSHYDYASIAADARRRFDPQVIAKQLTVLFEETMKR
jgi:glycosyltransferase involved in cell wall biosynthesis